MKSIRRKTLLLAGAVLLMCGFSACGNEPEEKYTSPNFEQETIKPGEKYTGQSTEKPEVVPSGLSEGDPVNGNDVDADLSTSTTLTGTYDGNTYYNPFAGFVIQVDGALWRMYDAAGVAAATGQTEDEVNRQWYGVVSPYSMKNMTCAIAYDADTGSNLIVSYVNPKLYYMKDMTAREYLELSARQYENVDVIDMDYLGETWSTLTIEEDREGVGRRAQFAIRKSDIIILLTYTLQGEDTLEDAASHVSKLITS